MVSLELKWLSNTDGVPKMLEWIANLCIYMVFLYSLAFMEKNIGYKDDKELD